MVTENKCLASAALTKTLSARRFTLPTLLLAATSLFGGSSAFAQADLSPLVWATHNTGAPQQFLIDHYTNGNIAGVVGEDLQIPPPQAGARKVTVAVIDTGIDYTHPQLKNIIVGKGVNFANPAQDATDQQGHGTHVAGIIAAQLDSRGFQGVSQNVMILPVKVVQTGPNAPIHPQDTTAGPGTALTEDVAKGIVWAIQNGAEVINLSLSWPSNIRSKTVDAAMAMAAQKNVIIVSSAANDSTTANLYPCIYENVICVGSHGPDGSLSHFSNYGPMVDINAPGVAILSTWPQTIAPSTFQGAIGYEFLNGTSMSSPFVAGAIAELLSRGFSPDEAKARLFLGSRPTAPKMQFVTDIQEQFTNDHSTETKHTRFGNVDIKGALAVTPSPLILPKKKGFYQIAWDGKSTQATIPMSWINRWKDAGAVKISVQGQNFSFPSLASGAEAVTNVQINLGANVEDILHLNATVDTDGYHKSDIELIVQIVHTFTSNSIPAGASVKKITGLDPTQYSDIRSVVNVGSNLRPDILFMRDNANGGTDIAIAQDGTFLASYTFTAFTSDQFLSLYRLPDDTYVSIFTKQDPNVRGRPNILIEKMDKNFKFLSEIVLGTDVTVLPETFTWVPFKGGYTPLWISIGFTPPLDQPAYDPWNPTYTDTKMPRAFFLDGNNLRTIKLASDELPLQVLMDGRLLISKGTAYLQTYTALELKDGQISARDPIALPEYRMLVGLDVGIPALDLSGGPSTMLSMPGTSTPGNMRVTSVGQSPTVDDVLNRSTILDALVTVSGTYQSSTSQYYFVQTDYYLQLFTAGSNDTMSTTLNRYSYIPSMIASRDFYPTVVRDQNGNGLPAMYIPANLDTGDVSEIIVADPTNQKIMRPANLHLQVTDGSCYEMGNLIQALPGQPAKQVFICNDSVVQIPLQLGSR